MWLPFPFSRAFYVDWAMWARYVELVYLLSLPFVPLTSQVMRRSDIVISFPSDNFKETFEASAARELRTKHLEVSMW